MKILLSGSSGLIGTALIRFLQLHGHHVVRLLRSESKPTPNAIVWDPESHIYSLSDFEGFDAVINLAGENIASGRWTKTKKKKILESRVDTTKLLSNCLSKLKHPPKVLINASAVGFYGDHGDSVVTESSLTGSGFLSKVCREWEAATDAARESGIRVVLMRFGTVLAPNGGALSKMVPPFKLGLGGQIGSGKQYMSWVAIDDVMQAILYVIQNASIQGPVNVVASEPVTNEEFSKTLGEVLDRPTFLTIPAFLAKIAFGELAEEGLLASTRAIPKRLTESGFIFRYPRLKDALKHMNLSN